jgi:hypothetical protein
MWFQAAAFERLGSGSRRGLPLVIGALDGSHVEIIRPAGTTDEYSNMKKRISILLQGVCDANGRFIDVYTGWTGRLHDARLFQESPLGQVCFRLWRQAAW